MVTSTTHTTLFHHKCGSRKDDNTKSA